MADDWHLDAELLERWRKGDGTAAADLYERHADAVIRFFRNKVRRNIDDLVQETFVRVIAAKERIRDGKALRAFVIRTANNVLFEHLRALNNARVLDPELDSIAALEPGPSTVAARKLEHRLLLEGLRSLPLRHQIVLELFYLEGLKANELAELMEVEHSTMRGRIKRARDMLRAEIVKRGASAALIASTVEQLEDWAADVRKLI